jgi:hypothetical protein
VDFTYECGGQQNLRQQGIRIERDWREQVIKLLSREKLVARIILSLGGFILHFGNAASERPGISRRFEQRHTNHAINQ